MRLRWGPVISPIEVVGMRCIWLRWHACAAFGCGGMLVDVAGMGTYPRPHES